jgi:phenylpropionate dioxygenase-like ring-hydroxylating dioxygenase large terminal subunit
VSELGEAGAFFTTDVEGTPVLVTRDARGTIRALVNICRHQGARLVHEQKGVTKSFTCILHGWNYDVEGNMGGGVLAKLAQGNPMLATLRATNSLTPLPCELRHGFVWVMPRPRDAIDVAAFLGPLDTELAARGVEHWVIRERTEEQAEAEAPTRFVFHDAALSVYSVRRRRAESDFGEGMTGKDALTLERLVLAPA